MDRCWCASPAPSIEPFPDHLGRFPPAPEPKRVVARLAVLVCALGLLSAAPAAGSGPSAGAAFFKRCNLQASVTIVISSVRKMKCVNAKREIRRYDGFIKYRFRTPHRFRCRRASGNSLGGQWRCKRRSKVFRFNFGD